MADFPEGGLASIRVSNAKPLSLSMSGLSFGERYTSIWLRRVVQPSRVSDRLAAADVKMALLESKRFDEAFRTVLFPGSVWINPPNRKAEAASKPHQLRTARQVGFAIPETLFSNDPGEIRQFYEEQQGRIIYKPFAPAFWEDRSSQKVNSLFTSRITESHFDQDSVAFTSCPGIYQEEIEKKAELRVTFFGSSFQAARIYSQQTASGKLDFRSDMRGESPMEAATLGPSTVDQCLTLLSALGLLHGSFDLVEKPDGSIVFLEINEMGQFLWLEERIPQLPLLAMFAAFSLEPSFEFVFEPRRWPAISFQKFLASDAYSLFREDLAQYVAASSETKAFCYPE